MAQSQQTAASEWPPRQGDRDQGLLGLRALVDEMAAQGVSEELLFSGTAMTPELLDEPGLSLTTEQKLRIFANARDAAQLSDFALRAGQRQRVSDFGIYGYAMASSATMGDALSMGFRHLPLAGPVLNISFELTAEEGIFRSHEPEQLGDLLPIAAEFWRASMHTLLSAILEAPFPNTRMLLPYKRPAHWRVYEQLFACPVLFEQDAMEWHFDRAVIEQSCPSANPVTAQMCQRLCDQILQEAIDDAPLVREVRAVCLNASGAFPDARAMSERLGMSLRTLHRRLAREGFSYKQVVDGVRKSLALEFLSATSITVEEVADRVGYSDAANFRKAFRRWTGQAPAEYRAHLHSDRAPGLG